MPGVRGKMEVRRREEGRSEGWRERGAGRLWALVNTKLMIRHDNEEEEEEGKERDEKEEEK